MVNEAVPAPDPTYRFQCTIGGATVAFSSVSGLEIGVATIEYKDGLGNWFQMPGQASALNITLRRGAPGSVSGVWKQWADGVGYNEVDKRDLPITLTAESGDQPLVSWNVMDAFPVKVAADDRDGDGTYEFQPMKKALPEKVTFPNLGFPGENHLTNPALPEIIVR